MGLGRRDVERFVEEQVEAFEEALHGVRPVELPATETILLALDQSQQDELVVSLGTALAHRLHADLVLTSGFPEEAADAAEAYVSKIRERLRRGGLESRVLWPTGEEPFERILRTVDEAKADLLVLPAPYFRDIETLGEDSVGTTLDVVLTRSPIPVLVVRDPQVDAEEVLERVRLAIFDADSSSHRAAEWALALVAQGRLAVLALVEEELVERIEGALGPEAISEEEIAERLARGFVPLVSAVVRWCAERGMECDVTYETEDLVRGILEGTDDKPALLVLRGYVPEDRPAEKVARDVILRSRMPVLVVRASAGAG